MTMDTIALDIIQKNFANLTSLWQEVSQPYDAVFHQPEFSYSFIKDAAWPNRLWFHQEVTALVLKQAKERLQNLPQPMVIPSVELFEGRSEKLFAQQGFRVLFEQIGMSLKLNEPFETGEKLALKRVTQANEAKLWSQLFEQAFGYQILPDLLMTSPVHAHFFTVYNAKQQAVGTALWYQTDDIVGLHAIGVVPAMRRKGYAEAIMKQLLNQAINEDLQVATLQASMMGKGLYQKLGFVEDFAMKNYVL